MLNAQHERRGAAAPGQRVEAGLDGWPPSAPCCGWPGSSNSRQHHVIAQPQLGNYILFHPVIIAAAVACKIPTVTPPAGPALSTDNHNLLLFALRAPLPVQN